jgi:hypothetical protein
MEKIIRVSIENRKGEDFTKKEIVIQNYPFWIVFIICIVVLCFLFKYEITEGVQYLLIR